MTTLQNITKVLAATDLTDGVKDHLMLLIGQYGSERYRAATEVQAYINERAGVPHESVVTSGPYGVVSFG